MTQENTVCILLAVWGEKFIKDFLRLSLPSLLAPGNIPALTKEYKTRFVFLTQTIGIPVFEKSSAIKQLKKVCEVSFLAINDLIVLGNYSTTLTLAYDRAIKQAGEAMLNTYFIFLTSDYIMADGSFMGLMRYMQKGYSGICAGNFQVIEEDIKPYLLRHINKKTHVLQIKARELLEASFKSLHPIACASIYHQNIIHNYQANRFFLHYDQTTLVGRYYLLHMLCIKPETMHYKIGASCDYSFIPEMCHSGNVGIITDSDDYLVVEIQPKSHELKYVSWGAYNFKKLSRALSEWTTRRHRQNAKYSIYFHTRDIAVQEKINIEHTLNEFILSLNLALQTHQPKSYRDHPYWIGAIQSLIDQRKVLKDCLPFDYFDLRLVQLTPLKKLYYYFLGLPPKIYPWHYRFREYRAILSAFRKAIALAKPENTLVLYSAYQSDFMGYYQYFKEKMHIPHHYHLSNLFNSPNKINELSKLSFTTCVLLVNMGDLKNISKTLLVVKDLLRKNSKVIMLIAGHKNEYPRRVHDMRESFSHQINGLAHAPYRLQHVTTFHSNTTFLGSFFFDKIDKLFSYNKKLRLLLYALIAAPGSLLCLIRNSVFGIVKSKIGYCTDILLMLTPIAEQSDDQH